MLKFNEHTEIELELFQEALAKIIRYYLSKDQPKKLEIWFCGIRNDTFKTYCDGIRKQDYYEAYWDFNCNSTFTAIIRLDNRRFFFLEKIGIVNYPSLRKVKSTSITALFTHLVPEIREQAKLIADSKLEPDFIKEYPANLYFSSEKKFLDYLTIAYPTHTFKYNSANKLLYVKKPTSTTNDFRIKFCYRLTPKEEFKEFLKDIFANPRSAYHNDCDAFSFKKEEQLQREAITEKIKLKQEEKNRKIKEAKELYFNDLKIKSSFYIQVGIVLLILSMIIGGTLWFLL